MNRILLTSLILLSSCAVGPDYQIPDLNLPEQYAEDFTKGDSDKAAELVSLRWWESFDDATLNSLIADAVVSNKDVGQALARINQSRAIARAALAELLPGTQLSGNYEKSRSSNARFPDGNFNSDSEEDGGGFRYEVYNASVDALWELDIFGRLRRELEARNAQYEEQVASLDDVVRMVVAEVALSYFGLRGAQSELAIAEKNAAIQSETLGFVQTKVKFGAAGELDSARALAQYEATKGTIPPLRAKVKAQIHRISVLLGKQPTALNTTLSPVAPLPSFKGTFAIDNPTDLLRRRPDLRAAERNLAAQTALIGMHTGALFPKIEISGSIGVEAATFSALNDNAKTYRFGPSITWAPLDTGRLRSQVHAQEARTEEALLAFEHAVLRALEDVENSLANFSAAHERLTHLKAAFTASARAHELATTEYKEGVSDFLTVLDAQQTMLTNEQNYIQGQQATATALIGIYKALGGGWEEWSLGEKK